jgi:hypothetical protein
VRKRLSVFLLLSVIAFPASPAEASETSSSGSLIDTDRKWTITIPLWIPGYRGQFTIGDIEVGGGSPAGPGLGRLFASDVQIRFFFMGSVAYEWNRWRVSGDIFGGSFTDDVIFTLNDATVVSASLLPVVIRAHLDYRVLDHSWDESATPRVRGWVYAGVRYFDVQTEVDVSQQTERLTARWADPIVGARIPVDLSSHWWVELSGDMGGFGLGSEFSWTTYAGLTYRVSQLFSLTLAYSLLDVNYAGTVGSREFRWKAHIGGPGLGIRFAF